MRLFIDGHNDTMMRILDRETRLPLVDLGGETDFHIDLAKLRQGGLNSPSFAAFSEGYYDGQQDIERSLDETLSLINGLYFTESKNREDFRIVADSQELLENFRAGRISALATIEGAYFIDRHNYREILAQLKDLKIRMIGFNWNYSNYLGEGAAEHYSDKKTPSQGGLTELGAKVLAEMEELGLAIDVSHMNERTFWGVVENTKNPIIASHSGAYELRPHRRNLKDDQLRAIKESGGLVGLVLCNSFLTDDGQASLRDYMDHLNYIVDLIGVDHVGIGSDLDGTTLPVDLKDASELGKLVELLEEDYGPEDLDKILGGNYLRIFKKLDEGRKTRDLDLEVQLDYEMGQLIGPGRRLKIVLPKEDLAVRLILDGIEMEYFISEERELEVEFDLDTEANFHVLTVEIEEAGLVSRKTRILYFQ